MRLKPLAAALLLLPLAGCFGGGGGPDQLLTLTAAESRPPASPRTAGQGAAVTVAEPSVPQALRTNRVPVYVNETTIQYLTGAAWVEYPGPLFARLLGETIAVRTGRVVLDPGQYSHDPGTRVTGNLVKFGLDPAAMEAVAIYDAAIAQQGGGVRTNRFEARVQVSEATAEAVAPALNQAANQVAEQVAAWVGQ
ncbi:ABC-type transport auxiliary lipoprotein family protein [Sphingosinicella sp. LHD-64]|uniref:ABC-type transport auxiliary lipoprotein family protein n=1 Tax=Sphingosinicella sp. LHD-64 TaxID=3072139 RepID=UPI00280C8E3E|nr:ABC-type transport auxiliary lipoprotein family protein [Sphingosinicella sp. LHD-64]MDQ8758334.1 ABC-type transport auxiliary lipoprotein family protein [Sphingosinicella sp. LHD-64]